MKEACPSRTALRVAMRRAAHQLFDGRPLVLDDPIAVAILGQYAEELHRTPGRSSLFKPRPFSIGLRAFVVARSRYAEDQLAQAAGRGVTQYVLLGAGLDTFAHRSLYSSVRVFEVDHPATQRWKRELLRAAGLPEPGKLTYVPVDFERQSLAKELSAAGFDPAAPSLSAWLGVVPYLTLEAFRATVRFIAGQPSGSGVVFDYGQPRAALSPREQLAHDSLALRVRHAGEPFRLFFTPEQVAVELAAFRETEDLGSLEINARYFTDRMDGLKVLGSAGRLLSARL
ncbi:MAG: SAM-dependent methyltransferase [Acidobacteriaceae bacterium]|jgi:methyltransferase (TIGR00027 family)